LDHEGLEGLDEDEKPILMVDEIVGFVIFVRFVVE